MSREAFPDLRKELSTSLGDMSVVKTDQKRGVESMMSLQRRATLARTFTFDGRFDFSYDSVGIDIRRISAKTSTGIWLIGAIAFFR